MSLAHYVQVTEKIRNPDITQDWNIFLENFADIEFCIVGELNETATTLATPTTETHVSPDNSEEKGDTLPTTEGTDYGPRNYSVSMLLTVSPTRDFLNIPHNVTYLSGVVLGKQLGLGGAAGEEPVNITMHLPYEWNNTKCSQIGCDHVKIYTCVHFQASSSVFPSSRSPEMCESVNDTGIEYHARMMPQHAKNMFTSYYCRSRPLIRVNYKINPSLTMMLTLRDRSVINLHLMHTSYFLFVMVVMLMVYALLRGRPNVVYTQAETDMRFA
jgi:hypothetical protein